MISEHEEIPTPILLLKLAGEWALTHCVLTGQRMVEVMGTDVLTYNHNQELKEGFRW